MKAFIVLSILTAAATSTALAQDTSPIVHEGIIEAPIESVWAAWATAEGLRSWMAPHAEIDARIGGTMRSNYNVDEDLDGPNTIENVILSLEPSRMMSFRVSRTPEDFPFPNAVKEMWSILYLSEAGVSRTHLRVVSLGFTPDRESQDMRAFFLRGNAATVAQLQRRFAPASNAAP